MLRLCHYVLSILTCSCIGIYSACVAAEEFNVGAAKVDITGPFVAASSGYTTPGFELSGLGMRLYSRAFVIDDGVKTVALVTADQLLLFQSIKLGVVKALNERGYGNVFKDGNVLVSATHTHAAGTNTSWYTLFNLFNGVAGFDPLHYSVVVQGITDSIVEAYESRQPASISFAQGPVNDAAFNRSSLAYNQNVDADMFDSNVDGRMSLLRFETLEGEPIGLLNYFGIHATSLGIHNTRAHGDNKGWAAYKYEKELGNNFVAAFAQGANGDASPNHPDPSDVTLPFLRPSDLDSTLDKMEDPLIAGDIQYGAARSLYESAAHQLNPNVDYRHRYVNFNNVSLDASPDPLYMKPWDFQDEHFGTCVGVVGAGFLSGVEEQDTLEHGAEGEVKNSYQLVDNHWQFEKFDLRDVDDQLFNVLGLFWPIIENVLQTPKYDLCHKEKFAILPVGEVDDYWFPNPEVPFIPVNLPLQIIALGDVVIVAAPFEITAMAWRRIHHDLQVQFPSVNPSHIVLAGLSNAYGMYLTTREEYSAQHYEGSFTSFGPWTRAVVTQELGKLAEDLVLGVEGDAGPQPPDLSDQQYVLTPISRTGVVTDQGNYGSVLQQPKALYSAANDEVTVKFRAAHPRTVLEKRMDGSLSEYFENYSFIEIQKKQGGVWQTVAKDDDPYTFLDWAREGGTASLSAKSSVEITWLTRHQQQGVYRVKYNGLAKEWRIFGTQYKAFSGVSNEFVLY